MSVHCTLVRDPINTYSYLSDDTPCADPVVLRLLVGKSCRSICARIHNARIFESSVSPQEEPSCACITRTFRPCFANV